MKRTIGCWLAYVVLVPVVLLLLVILSPIWLPVVLVAEWHATISFWAFRRREAGNYYLVCTSRRGWHDALRNNVIPVLPANVKVIWHRLKRNAGTPRVVQYLWRLKIFNVSKPYLVAVTKKRLEAVSLNLRLQEIKRRPCKDDATTSLSRRIVQETMESFLTDS